MTILRTMFYVAVVAFLVSWVYPAKAAKIVPICTTIKSNIICAVQLPESISSVDNYKAFYETLRGMEKNDSIVIRMSGFGGSAHLMMKISSAIRASKGMTTIEVIGPVYSAHAFISMSAKQLLIRDYTFFMFHRLRTSSMGEANVSEAEMCRAAVQIDKCMANTKAMLVAFHDTLLRNGLKKIFTKSEMKSFLGGYDVYIQGHEMRRRLSK